MASLIFGKQEGNITLSEKHSATKIISAEEYMLRESEAQVVRISLREMK